MSNAYILVIDRNFPGPFDDAAFCQSLNSDPLIQDWAHQLPTMFIFITTYFPQALAQKMKTLMPNRGHLIIRADLSNSSGLLPKEAWDWLNTRAVWTMRLP